jgi:hypothetical protein
MAIEDLDLEFEDEGEVSGTEALDVSDDLSFSANEEDEAAPKRSAPKKRPQPRSQEQSEEVEDSEENISDIGQARARTRPNQSRQPISKANNHANGQSRGMGSNGDLEDLKEEIAILKQQMQAIEHQADVRVAVAEAEKEYLIEYVSNAKLLDHQVTQVLSRINKKVPQLVTEVKMVKKYMQDFLVKSNPKKKKDDAA